MAAEELQNWLDNALREYVYHRENKVCVVGLIGKAPTNELWTKGALINEILNKKAFENLPFLSPIGEKTCKIEAYFDVDSQCVFLNLISPYELNVYEYGSEDDQQSFHQWWVKQDETFAANLLFLFLVSQIVLVVHPTCRFDLSYIRLFRNLNHLREKTINNVLDLLADVNGVSKGWVSEGRASCPRVLFLFHRPPSFMKPDGTVETRRGSYRKLAACLEDQIYKLFRKSRVVTNNSAVAVCALPLKQSFCYIFAPSEEPKDFTLDLLTNLKKAASATLPVTESADSSKHHNSDDVGFREFFLDHADLAHGDGFNDNVGKVGPAHFELPKFKAFVRAASILYNFIVVKRSESTDFNETVELIDVVSKFSEGRCNKVLPIAISSYQDSLPQFYTQAQHQAKVLKALQILQQQARGPALDAARKKLSEECESYWRNGRRACEMFSLTGNNCINKMHRTSEKDVETVDVDAPIMEHNSKVNYLCTCNCGRRQAWRDDPFELRQANFTFYEENEEFTCCRHLDRIDFPVYKRTTVANVDSSRKISVEQLFDNLKITPTTQEELSGQTRSDGDDFLLDRDNKPKAGSGSQAEQHEAENVDEEDERAGGEVASKSAPVESTLSQEIEELLLDEDAEVEEPTITYSPHEAAQENESDVEAFHMDGVASSSEDKTNAAFGNGNEGNYDERNLAPNEDLTEKEIVQDEEQNYEDETGDENGLYLMGMVHNQCAGDLLPLFSSWSLVCLGHSSIYSHSGGLRDNPNFSHGSQYLLPWDVSLQVDTERWHDLMEMMASSSKRLGAPYKKTRPMKGRRDDTVTVKVFVGFEYECPRGHRYMLQTPEKMLKFQGPGGPKDSGEFIAKNDMPLWFPCSCRQAKPSLLGQLMRVHVVTPKAPVIVTLNPKVQPLSNLNLFFYPGAPGPAKLGPAKYWVLRFPFSYVGPNGTLFPPKDAVLSAGRVLKGMLGVLPDL